ncbi:ArsR family transcriptional regulator [Epilithonimonas zeae]|uniref:ArsR family transcriptional regulator n=1 Tax=Epilithonimonas zeae TaxID=1416779 RepID=UPI00200D89B0|nr:ArsR family transcriptional regulator [Epilithonimonas zeae]UQB69341.1 ArsR family transcriptional regulator [Epilithonimonas zeae]
MSEKQNKKPVKLCYEHIGGKLGELLLERFIAKGWIEKADPKEKNYLITAIGEIEFAKLGIDLSKIKS